MSTVFVPSPILTSAEPLPSKISPVAFVNNKSSPLCSILPALAPAAVLNCT